MYWVFKSVEKLVGLLPLKTAVTLGGGIGVAVGRVFKPRRAETAGVLKRCLPELSEAERTAVQDGVFRSLGRCFTEIFWYGARGTGSFRERMVIAEKDQASIQELRKQHGTFLVLTAHLGNLELFATMSEQIEIPITAVVKQIKQPGASRYWAEKREQLGLKTLPSKRSFRECIQAIRNTQTVAMIMDQAQPAKQGVITDFFGSPAVTSPGLALLSAQTQIPVLPAFMVRTGLIHHQLKILPVIPPPENKRKETIQAFTQRYTRALEDMIREHPDQWIWMHRRWKNTTPLPAQEAKSPV